MFSEDLRTIAVSEVFGPDQRVRLSVSDLPMRDFEWWSGVGDGGANLIFSVLVFLQGSFNGGD